MAVRGLGPLLGTSALGHLGLGLGLYVLGSFWAPQRPPPRQVVMARLVRLGSPRPKELLPRLSEEGAIAAPSPPAASAPAPTVSPPARPPPPSPSPPSVPDARPPAAPPPVPAGVSASGQGAKERARSLGKLRRALDRIGSQAGGAADGDAAGDAENAVLGERYSAEIDACLHAHYVIEGYVAQQVAGARAEVLLRIGSTGKIVDYRLVRSSGVGAFDQAVGRAVARCGKLSPPPAHLRRAIAQEGIEVTFKP